MMQTLASKYAIWKTGKQNKDTDYIPKQSEGPILSVVSCLYFFVV